MSLKHFDLEGFGSRLRSQRQKLGYTQDQLADLVRVAASAVRRWEAGALPGDTVTLATVSEVLEVSVGWLLGDTRDNAYREGWNAGIEKVISEVQAIKDASTQKVEEEDVPPFKKAPEPKPLIANRQKKQA